MKRFKRNLLVFCVILTVFTSLFPFQIKSSAVSASTAIYYPDFDVSKIDLSKMPSDWYNFVKSDYFGCMINVSSKTQFNIFIFDTRTWAPAVRMSDGALFLVKFSQENSDSSNQDAHWSFDGSIYRADTSGNQSYVQAWFTWSAEAEEYTTAEWSVSSGRLASFVVNAPSGANGTATGNLNYYSSGLDYISGSSKSDVYLKGQVYLKNNNAISSLKNNYVVWLPCQFFNANYDNWGDVAQSYTSFPSTDCFRTVSYWGTSQYYVNFLTTQSNSINSSNQWVGRLLSNFPTFESQQQNTQKGILAAIKAIPEKIGSFFTELANKISGFFTQLGDRISGFFSELANKIQGYFTELTNKVSGFFTTLKNYLLWFNKDGEASYTNPFSNLLTGLQEKIEGYIADVEAFNDTLDETLDNVVTYIEQGSGAIQLFLTGVPIVSAFLLFFVVFCVVRKVVGR